MNVSLFERSTGNIGPNAFARLQTTQLLHNFRPAPRFRFDGGERIAFDDADQDDLVSTSEPSVSLWAHQAGINALALERFDGRILISGGSDGTIRLWDLERCENPTTAYTYRPVAEIPRAAPPEARPLSRSRLRGQTQVPHHVNTTQIQPLTSAGHRFGITHLSFYPFDSAAFMSSSYDQTLKLWATEEARLSGTFPLGAKVYTHALSPVASHLLVACGTQHPAVRLVDLRSGAAVQSLVAPGTVGGAAGAVLAVAWSPRHEHVLASGTLDGAVRIWDVRRASGMVALLDQEDSVGIAETAESTNGGRGVSAGGNGSNTGYGALRERGIRTSAKAHAGPVNSLAWTDDGAYIVSAGLDRRIRVWDAATGANTLANFGPTVRNSQLATVTMFTSSVGLTPPKQELLFWPNETEIVVFDLHRGTTITRLRGLGPNLAAVRARRGGERTVRNRITSLVWRGAGGGGGSSGVVMGGTNAAGGIYSGHLDGQIRAWLPQLEGGDDEELDPSSAQVEDEDRSRKRKAIDDVYKSLMGRKVTFI
ncbi:hypothetical protein VTK73DRAFT_6705 [Phialemonium thermophilum]|uniref:DNA excision repair protein ERCC-8 n=1 Tax=Phialemonium thermophilum TaxID=223376 RepID=A0ABR3XV48_9PEZI